MDDDGFHQGELLAQERAGVGDDARRLAAMLSDPAISAGMSRFVAERELVFLTSIDGNGRLWTSPLFGSRGFCDGHARTLAIAALPAGSDPLRDIESERPAGLLFVDFDRRRRLRVNGVVSRADAGGLEIAVRQAFGNCPRYIHQLRSEDLLTGTADRVTDRDARLDAADVTQIMKADRLILGTRHPGRGADTSHRGGSPGFVHLRGGDLSWPDYPGNNLFNSIGNLLIDPAASLLFLDPQDGRILYLSGRAGAEWLPADTPGSECETGRRLRFTPEIVVRSRAHRLVAPTGDTTRP